MLLPNAVSQDVVNDLRLFHTDPKVPVLETGWFPSGDQTFQSDQWVVLLQNPLSRVHLSEWFISILYGISENG